MDGMANGLGVLHLQSSTLPGMHHQQFQEAILFIVPGPAFWFVPVTQVAQPKPGILNVPAVFPTNGKTPVPTKKNKRKTPYMVQLYINLPVYGSICYLIPEVYTK